MKNIFLVLFFLSLTSLSMAQVKFNLELLPDNETYEVSLLPQESVQAPYNTAANIQVILKAPITNEKFRPVQIMSHIPNVQWVSNAHLDEEGAVEPYTLISISLGQNQTNKIELIKDQSVPLFTFKSQDGYCPDKISLPLNSDEAVLLARENQLNFTQNYSMLGYRGNAYLGNVNDDINCADQVLSVEGGLEGQLEVNVFPIPTSKILNVKFETKDQYNDISLTIVDLSGKVHLKEFYQKNSAIENLLIDVSNYTPGLYTVRMVNDSGLNVRRKFIVAK